MNDITALFLRTREVIDCPVQEALMKQHWQSWRLGVSNSWSKSLKHGLALGKFSSQQAGPVVLACKCQTHVLDEAKIWANRNTQAVTNRYAHASAHTHAFSHFLLYFCFSGAFSALEQGCDFSQQCVEIVSNRARTGPAVLLKKQQRQIARLISAHFYLQGNLQPKTKDGPEFITHPV